MKLSQKRIVSAFLALLMCLSVFVFIPSVADTALDVLAADKLSLKSGSELVIDGAYLRNVGELVKVSSILSSFSNSSVSAYDVDGTKLSDSDIVGTGTTVSLMSNGNKVNTLTIVILGDVSGDGEVNATDYVQIRAKFFGYTVFSDAAYSAGDIDGDTLINATDYLKVKGFFLEGVSFPSVKPPVSSEDEEISEEVSDVPSEAPSEDDSSGIESETKTNYAYQKTYTAIGEYLSDKEDNGTLITDGVIPSAEATNATIAFVGTGVSSSITINLAAKYVDINEIVVAGVVEYSNRNYGSVTIEVSSNGVSYTALSGYSSSYEQYADNIYKYTYKLASEVTAKFVRITFVSKAYVLTVGEIEVYGGNAPVSSEPDPEPMPTDDRLYIAKTGGLWEDVYDSDGIERCKDSNAVHLAFPGTYVGGLYYYKIMAIYNADVNGYVINIAAASHRSYDATVPSNGIGLIFYFNPGDMWGRNFAMEQHKVWTKLRPGDILRPHGIDVANRTLDLTGAIHPNNNLVTNAYFEVEYASRNIPQTLYNGKTVVALGDSVTENGGWVESVSDLIGTTIINSGISGNTTTDCLARFDRDVAAYNPDVVLIMLGINDSLPYEYSNKNLETYIRELGTLYDKCTAIGAEVVFMLPNDVKVSAFENYARYRPYGGYTAVYNQFLNGMRSVAAQKGCHLIDNYTPIHNTGNVTAYLLPGDTVHPNDYGYEMFKETISGYLLANQASICG